MKAPSALLFAALLSAYAPAANAQSARDLEKVICGSKDGARYFIQALDGQDFIPPGVHTPGCGNRVAEVAWGAVVDRLVRNGRLYKVREVTVERINENGKMVSKDPPLHRFSIVYERMFSF